VVGILRFWPDFQELFQAIPENTGKLNRFLEAIEALTEIGKLQGYITDKDIISHTEDIIPTAAAIDIFDFEQYTFNRWRAVWMNSDGTLSRRKKWNDDRHSATIIAEQKRQAAASKKAARKSAKPTKVVAEAEKK